MPAKILAFIMYHKTGTHLGNAVISSLHLQKNQFLRDCHFPTISHKNRTFLPWGVNSSFERLFYNDSMKVIQFVRDPWDRLVSAYNYHMKASELWLLWGNTSWQTCPDQNVIDCMRALNLTKGIVEETRFMWKDMHDMVKGFKIFQQYPDRAINLCLSEWKRNMVGTVAHLCDFIGHDSCVTKDVVDHIVKRCMAGHCNIAKYGEKAKIECRPTGVIGECDEIHSLQQMRQCLQQHELSNRKETNVTCCSPSKKLYEVSCYDKPDFQVATLTDVRETIKNYPYVFDQLERWREVLGCHHSTDGENNVEV